MMHFPEPPSPSRPHSSNGARLVSTTGRALPLRATFLAADAAGGVARVTVRQRFHNPHAEPLAVTYSLPLPSDGAVSGFSFQIGSRLVVGEIDRKQAARERYEQALVEGRSAALLEQDRSSLFTQEIGNIPPGEEVTVEVSVDQRLRWLEEGAWEWRFPTVVAPRYLGEPGRVPDADKITQDVATGPLAAWVSFSCVVRDFPATGGRVESTSHALDVSSIGEGLRLEMRDPSGARLDRDVVLRWWVARPRVGLSLDAGRAEEGSPSRHAHGLLTLVPPSIDAGTLPVRRDLIVLLDTSGSMSGEPLAQAVRVTSALVDSLRDHDLLEIIEFSSAPRRFMAAPMAATEAGRREAMAWLRRLRASGGTEMRSGILEALAGVRPDAQRQVVLITDGQIGFESQVVAAICDRLPSSSRLHTVGVGAAVNRSLTQAAARAGHGVEVILGLGEDPERAVLRLAARTTAPLVVDLTLSGSALVDHAPARLPDLFAGAPALVAVALHPDGGDLTVRGRTLEGTWEQTLRVAPLAKGEGSAAAVKLFGREAVEDLETRLAAGGDPREIDAAIERVGMDFQIATRLTSWVAVSEERTVDPGDSLRRQRMPHELPYGMSAEGLGLRAPAGTPRGTIYMPSAAAPKSGVEVWSGRPGVPMSAGGSPRRRATFDPRGGGLAGGGFGGSGGAPGRGGQDPRRKKTEAEDEPRGRKEAPPAAPPAEVPASPAMQAPPADSVDRMEEAPGLEPPARLRGRIVLHKADLLVIEIAAGSAALAWAPGTEVALSLADGRVVRAGVRRWHTTKPGTVAPGVTVRLALALPAGVQLQGVRSVGMVLAGRAVVIEL